MSSVFTCNEIDFVGHINSFKDLIVYSSLNKQCQRIAYEHLVKLLNENYGSYSFSELKSKVKDLKLFKSPLNMKMDEFFKRRLLFIRVNDLSEIYYDAIETKNTARAPIRFILMDLNQNLEEDKFIEELQDIEKLFLQEIATSKPKKSIIQSKQLNPALKEVGWLSSRIKKIYISNKNFFSNEFHAAEFTMLAKLLIENCQNFPSNALHSRLKTLKVDNCSFVKFDTIKSLTHLKVLNLRNMGLTQIPDFIMQFPNLQKLDVYGNGIELLPEFISKINFKKLVLANNPIKNLPEDLSLRNLYTSEKTALPRGRTEAAAWYQELKEKFQRQDYLLRHNKERSFSGMLSPNQELKLKLMEDQLIHLENQYAEVKQIVPDNQNSLAN